MDECVSWSSKALYLFRQIIYWSRNIIFFFFYLQQIERREIRIQILAITLNYENFDHHKAFWDIYIMYIIV